MVAGFFHKVDRDHQNQEEAAIMGHFKRGFTAVSSLNYFDRMKSRNSEKLSPVLTRTEMGF